MSNAQPSVLLDLPEGMEPVVNDFSITVGTVNGSGSQTANITLMRTVFRMGVPVVGKNLFPSNIQGLPTWFTIRISEQGYLARREEHEIVVAMNPASFARDLADVKPGGVFCYDDSIKQAITRDDIVVYPVPVKKLVRAADVPSKLRSYVANMVYVGVLAHILGLDTEAIRASLDFHFKGKASPVQMNMGVVEAAAQWAKENLEKKDPYMVRPANKTDGYIMADGNTAAALGAIYGGVQFVAWYPITPASSLAETLNMYLPKLRKDADGKHTFAVVQAEDELAAAGMAIGAGWSGLRAMTSTSGAGISLMTEFVGLAYAAEVPVVIWNVARVGPSTGLPTRTGQGDLTMTYFLGHGDTNHVILLPADPSEAFEFGWKAFDLAEYLQGPVFVLSDLDLGMNQWMTRPFEYPDRPMNRGKILWEEDVENFEQKHGVRWGRYLDVDGDGIPYRTVPGNRSPKSAYFTRGTGHDDYARYSEDPETWERTQARIKAKYAWARQNAPQPVVYKTEGGAKIGLIGFGTTEAAILEARDQLQAAGIPTDFLRVRSIPFAESVAEFIRTHERVYVVELNRDGQLHQLLTINFPEQTNKLVSVAHLDGLPMTARWAREQIMAQEVK